MSAAAPVLVDVPPSPHVASYRGSPASTSGGQQEAVQPAVPDHGTTNRVETCQVVGCGHELRDNGGEPRYYKRFRICKYHCTLPSLELEGRTVRFCQQCGRFQALLDFDGDRKSCRASLMRHNERRRRKGAGISSPRHRRKAVKEAAKAAAAAAAGPGAEAAAAAEAAGCSSGGGGSGGGAMDALVGTPTGSLVTPFSMSPIHQASLPSVLSEPSHAPLAPQQPLSQWQPPADCSWGGGWGAALFQQACQAQQPAACQAADPTCPPAVAGPSAPVSQLPQQPYQLADQPCQQAQQQLGRALPEQYMLLQGQACWNAEAATVPLQGGAACSLPGMQYGLQYQAQQQQQQWQRLACSSNGSTQLQQAGMQQLQQQQQGQPAPTAASTQPPACQWAGQAEPNHWTAFTSSCLQPPPQQHAQQQHAQQQRAQQQRAQQEPWQDVGPPGHAMPPGAPLEFGPGQTCFMEQLQQQARQAQWQQQVPQQQMPSQQMPQLPQQQPWLHDWQVPVGGSQQPPHPLAASPPATQLPPSSALLGAAPAGAGPSASSAPTLDRVGSSQLGCVPDPQQPLTIPLDGYMASSSFPAWDCQALARPAAAPGATCSQPGACAAANGGGASPAQQHADALASKPQPSFQEELEAVSLRLFQVLPEQLAPHVREGVIKLMVSEPGFVESLVRPVGESG